MNRPPIRLGPLALLLLIVAVALSTLSILTFTTAKADLTLAKRFARSVEIRYELEKEGNRFLAEVAEDPSALQGENVTYEDGHYCYRTTLDGYTLTIILKEDTSEFSFWQIRREWEHDDTIDNLWDGK